MYNIFLNTLLYCKQEYTKIKIYFEIYKNKLTKNLKLAFTKKHFIKIYISGIIF